MSLIKYVDDLNLQNPYQLQLIIKQLQQKIKATERMIKVHLRITCRILIN